MQIEEQDALDPNLGQDAADNRPDEIPKPDGPPTYGDQTNNELPEQLKNALSAIVKECQQQEEYDRRREVLRDRRNRFYDRGFQHIYEDPKSHCFAEGIAGGVIPGTNQLIPSYIDNYNVFAPCLEILIAELSQNPPGIDFQPKNMNRSQDLQASDVGEGYRKKFDRDNKAKDIQKEIIRMFGLSGRTVLWVRNQADQQLLGKDKDGTPKERVTVTVHGTLETKVPLLATTQQNSLYCFISLDLDVKQAKAMYPEFETEIKGGSTGVGETEWERAARLGVLQGSRSQISEAYSHIATEMHAWLRPANFRSERVEDDIVEEPLPGMEGEEGIPTVRDALETLYPNGCHVVYVGETYVGSWDESMDSAIKIGFPYPGDGMSRPAMMDRGVVFQDRINDDRNAYADVKDHGWPSTWVDADEAEWEAFKEQRADPYTLRLKKSRNQQALDQSFFREPDPMIPETFVADTDNLLNMLYFVLATPPALFGQAEADQKTASGFAQMRAQAMGRLGLAWSSILDMMASMYYMAAMCATTSADMAEEIVVPSGTGQGVTLDLQLLTSGDFGAYPDEDSSFPESITAKRMQLQQIVELAVQSPEIGQQLLESPDNWEVMKRLLGFPELTIIEAEARNKQVCEIEQLLMTAPIPPDPMAAQELNTQHAAQTVSAMQMGQPPPPPIKTVTLPGQDGMPPMTYPEDLLQPSVPIDAEMDFNVYEGKKCQEWLSSADCRRQIAQGNQAGVLNVKLHGKLHLAAGAAQAAAMQAAMAPPAAPGKPSGPGGPPQAGAKPQGEMGAPNSISSPPGAPGSPSL